MPFSQLKSTVLDLDLCASCGGCVAVCPAAALTMGDDSEPHPVLASAEMVTVCDGCDLCVVVCPGLDPGSYEAEMRKYGRRRTPEERWTGIYRSLHAVASPVERLQRAAAAGAAGTAVLIAALRTRVVEAVLVIGREADRPWIPAPVLTNDEDTVVACAQSTYCIAPNLQSLADAPWDRIAMVGLPCQIQSLEKMRSVHPVPPAAAKVVLTLELACSSNTRRAGTEFVIERRLGLPLEDVTAVRYREGAYPGRFVVEDRAGERHSVPFHDMVQDFARFKSYRCERCPDWWSGLADLSICDADQNIYSTSREGATTAAASLVAIRTETGEHALAAAVDLGLLRTMPGNFCEAANLGLQRKRHRYNAALRQPTRPVPFPPGPDQQAEDLLSDEEVIERLSAGRGEPAC